MGIFDKFISRQSDDKEIKEYIEKIFGKPSNETKDNPSYNDIFTSETLNKVITLIGTNTDENNNNNNINTSSNISPDEKVLNELSNLIKDTTIPQERVKYYQSIEELYKTFPIARRIVSQYVLSICRVDPLTSSIFNYIRDNKFNFLFDELYELVKSKIELVNTFYNMEELFQNKIVNLTVLYGNLGVEILPKNQILKLDKLIEETSEEYNQKQKKYNSKKLLLEKTVDNITNTYFKDISSRYIDKISENFEKDVKLSIDYLIDILFDFENFNAEEDNVEINENEIARKSKLNKYLLLESTNTDNQQNNSTQLENIYNLYNKITISNLKNYDLLVHNPKYILPIHNKQKILGYIVFQETNESLNNDVFKYFYQLFNPSEKSENSTEQIIKSKYKQIIDYFISKLIKKFENELQHITDSEEKIKILLQNIYNYDKELFYIIRDLFVERKISKIKVRFVPAHRMVFFAIDVINWPYGQSVIEHLILYAKLYMLSLLSVIINKVSRSSVIRKWMLDVGIVQQHGKLIQKLKREIKSGVLTIDSLGSIRTIPKILTDFKDLITLQRNGKPFVDFMVQQTGDPSVSLQDLDFIKQEIISLSKIPSPYLGLVDTIELREQLVTANIIWAETISQYQKNFEDKLHELLDKIFINIIYDTAENDITNDVILPSQIIKLSLNKPVMLQLQYIDAVMASISNTLQILTSLPEGQQKFDLFKFLKHFIPSIDWSYFEKNVDDKEKQNIEQQLLANNNPNNNNPQQGFPPM